jgi:hypothetical protein
MFAVHDLQLLLTQISHHYVMGDLYYVGECYVMGELAHLIHRIRVDS